MAADVVKVVDQGLGITTDRLMVVPGFTDPPRWIGIGKGTTDPEDDETELENESVEDRAEGVLTLETESSADDTLQCVGTVTADGIQAVTECGQFAHVSDSAGYMFLHAKFDAIGLQVGNSIEFTIKTQFQQG